MIEAFKLPANRASRHTLVPLSPCSHSAPLPFGARHTNPSQSSYANQGAPRSASLSSWPIRCSLRRLVRRTAEPVRSANFGVARIVRHHTDGGSGGVQFAQQAHHGLAIGRIQVPGGLVGEQDQGIAAQRARHGDALLLTAGELRRDSASCGATCRRAPAPPARAACAPRPACRDKSAAVPRSRRP